MMIERAPAIGEEALADLDEIRGRLGAARRHWAVSHARDMDDRLTLAGFSARAEALNAPVAAAQLEADRNAVAAIVVEPNQDLYFRLLRLMLLGRLSALLGDDEAAARAAAELEAPAGSAEGSFGSDWASWIRATMARRAGRLPDAAALLEGVRGEAPSLDVVNGRAWLAIWAPIRYTRAEVLFQLGRYDEAERWFLTADRFWSDQFLAPRFRRLAQIADRRGDKVKSIAYYERFIDLWSDCDPDLRPQVEEARARLLALRGN